MRGVRDGGEGGNGSCCGCFTRYGAMWWLAGIAGSFVLVSGAWSSGADVLAVAGGRRQVVGTP
ncbi:hypothetical protein, partial [Actinoalloteichus caeruleus]|uniref:hypothetical protein n=1 Tax=Actinoalloteichus cyanogriseus TaxID=2893586 RepID=UPI001B80E50A